MPSPLRLLRSGPPPPKIALLPDALFFTRAVPITTGASAADAAAQIELALEAISPFPLAQLYYGWFWVPGAEKAFVFAAYRRRFTTDQTAEWEGAEVVMPAFAAVLGADDIKPATTLVLNTPEGLTAVHWETLPTPSKVLFRPVTAEATDEERAAAREELLRAIGGSKSVIDLEGPLTGEPTGTDREVVFRSGDFVSRLPATVTTSMDVRDKGELAALRGARKRDVLLWRVALGCAAALALLVVGELALVGGRMWNDVRVAKVRVQKTAVDRIEASHRLAGRIEELATKRLLPFEMITALAVENRRPEEIIFTQVLASAREGIHTLRIQAEATNNAQVPVYIATLRGLPFIERVEEQGFQTRGSGATFTLIVTFKPDALKPAESIAQ